jgi:hypothetical protein
MVVIFKLHNYVKIFQMGLYLIHICVSRPIVKQNSRKLWYPFRWLLCTYITAFFKWARSQKISPEWQNFFQFYQTGCDEKINFCVEFCSRKKEVFYAHLKTKAEVMFMVMGCVMATTRPISFSWGRFYETMSAKSYGLKLKWSNSYKLINTGFRCLFVPWNPKNYHLSAVFFNKNVSEIQG